MKSLQVKINNTGLRPGEKLREELVGYYEGTNVTKYKKILVINSSNAPTNLVNLALEKLSGILNDTDIEDFRELLASEVQNLNNAGRLTPA